MIIPSNEEVFNAKLVKRAVGSEAAASSGSRKTPRNPGKELQPVGMVFLSLERSGTNSPKVSQYALPGWLESLLAAKVCVRLSRRLSLHRKLA